MAHIIPKKNDVSLSLHGKQLIVFVDDDKLKLVEFWKIFVYDCELYSFLILKDFSNELDTISVWMLYQLDTITTNVFFDIV